MKFGNIHAAYLLLLVMGLFLFCWMTRKTGQKSLKAFAEKDLLAGLISSLDGKKKRRKAIFLFCAFVLCVLALMRPQGGMYWEEGERIGRDVLVAIDTSKSMLAEDVKPNRLDHAKQAVRNLVRELKGDRIGLIAFSGKAFLVCPLTVDYNGFMLTLDDLTVDAVPKGGTSLSSAIEEALKSYGGEQIAPKVLVILTDGEDHEGDPIRAAATAAIEGLKIFCIGIGTKEGDVIPMINEVGEREFLKDRQGNVVKSSLREDLLHEIASKTGGSYVQADQVRAWGELSRVEKTEFKGDIKKRHREWFQIPLAIALLLLILEPLISERRKNVERQILLGGPAIWITLTFLTACGNHTLSEAHWLYHEGKYEEALQLYHRELARAPGSNFINYNLGTAFYKKGDYGKATEHFVKALENRVPELEARVIYNIGNCKYRQGEQMEKTDLAASAELYKEALDYYRRSKELDEKDEDGKYNYRLTEKKLEDILSRLRKGTEMKKRHEPSQQFSEEKELNLQGDALERMGSEEMGTSGQDRREIEEMSRKEAERLLEGFRREKASMEKLNVRKRRGYDPDIPKDW